HPPLIGLHGFESKRYAQFLRQYDVRSSPSRICRNYIYHWQISLSYRKLYLISQDSKKIYLSEIQLFTVEPSFSEKYSVDSRP
ncbi:MAG TPA: hypothetical protein VK970_13205, partial [Candidatus Methylacidiphilales bacterium]|nr:hypothetical protein [Candidatus Methylacidiphilales bacterium]